MITAREKKMDKPPSIAAFFGKAEKLSQERFTEILQKVERARRVYARWVCHMVEGKVPHFSFAVRLLALMQPSSCAVERVFSQVKLIVEQTGSRSLEDLFLLRVFMRCNGSVHDQFGLVR